MESNENVFYWKLEKWMSEILELNSQCASLRFTSVEYFTPCL